MNTVLERRLAKLEQKQPESWRRAHQIIGDTDDEIETKMAALIASGEASESDLFICHLIIDPAQSGAAVQR
jgi:hypothetical protein